MNLLLVLCIALCKGVIGQEDVEFFSSSCPIQESIPGFKYENVSGLGIAALLNASEDINTFLQVGCDPNYAGTSLTLIETKCKNPVLEKLKISCARVVKETGYTPLLLAVWHGTAETVQKLAKIPQINLNAKTSTNFSPLWLAAVLNKLEIVKILVEAGANIDESGGEYLTTPLGEAVKVKNFEMVRYLLAKGADANSKSTTESSPIFYAGNNLEMIKLLKAGRADLDATNEKGATILHYAAANEDDELIDYLIKERVDLNKQDTSGYTALALAVIRNNSNAVRSLVDAGADLDIATTKSSITPLHYSIANGNTELALFLIERGADASLADSGGYTPVHTAAQKGNLVVLKALLEQQGTNEDLEKKAGRFEVTPLILAAYNGHLDVVKYLVAEGVNTKAEDKDGKTALNYAEDAGNDFIVQFLNQK